MIQLWRVKRWALLKNHVIYIQNWCDVSSKYCDVYLIILMNVSYSLMYVQYLVMYILYRVMSMLRLIWLSKTCCVNIDTGWISSLTDCETTSCHLSWSAWGDGEASIYEVLNLFISLQMIYIKHNGRNCMIIKLFFLCFLSCLENTNVSWG